VLFAGGNYGSAADGNSVEVFDATGITTTTGTVSGASATFSAFGDLSITAGQVLTISASGTICVDSPGCTLNAPPGGSGVGNGDPTAKLPGAPTHSLICGIGDQTANDLFFVGSSYSGIASRSGALFCGVNEQPGIQSSYNDNLGSWTLIVAIR
jgi:hypothetical protein